MAISTPVRTRATARQWAALAVLMIPVLLVSIDNLVLSFALPEISRELRPTGNQLMWMVDLYALMLAGLLIAMGSIGDRIGRRRLLLVGATGFGVASIVAATSDSAGQLIAARGLLGFFGAMLMPSTLSIIRNIFEDARDRRIAIATWAAMFSGGAALGPVVGGWILEHYAWGAVFLINVPLILVFLPLARLLLPESRDPSPGRLDVWSILGSMAMMVPFVFAIKHFASQGIDAVFFSTVAVGVMAFVWFIRRQRHSASPMVDLSLFRNRVFSGALLANGLSMMGLTGFLFFGAQLLQLVMGLSPLESALVLLPGLIVTMMAGFLAVKLVDHFPVHWLVGGSFVASSIGYVMVAFTGHPTALSVMVAFTVLGLGIGIAETLTNDLILSSVPAHKAGAASALSETAYEVGAVLGTAVLGSVLTATYQSRLQVPTAARFGDGQHAFETLGSTLQFGDQFIDPIRDAITASAVAAFDLGVQFTSGVAIVIAVAAGVVSWRALRHA